MDLSTPTPPPGSFTKTPAPDTAPPSAPEPEVDASTDPLDILLRQIIGGWFLLTDGQGAVSKWSEPAEFLFGKEAPEALGHSFFEGLLAGPLSEDAEQWRRFLTAGDPPRARALVDVSARHAPTGEIFPMEAVFVPVKLDEGFDFSLFLEDLSFELPMNLMLLRMRQQHPVVVRALRAALDEEPQNWDGWRTAGTMVAFRPLAPTPWVESEITRRAEERARQDAEREEAITNPDPGISGESIDDLDDAAAVVGRLLSALERIDDLERVTGRLPAEVDEAKREALASRGRAEAAEREAKLARAELERLNVAPGAPAAANPEAERERFELLARLERLERAALDAEAQPGTDPEDASARAELLARLERLESDRAQSAAAAEARFAAAESEAAQARTELAGRLAELESARGEAADASAAALREELAALRTEQTREAAERQAELHATLERIAESEAARGELGESLERVEREHDRELQAARGELAAALERIDAVQREAERLRERVGEVTVERAEGEALAGDDRRRLEELQREAGEARARLDALRALADELREHSVRSAEDAGTLRSELEAVRAQVSGDDAVRQLRIDLAALRQHVEGLEPEAPAGPAAEVDLTPIHRRFEQIELEESNARQEMAIIRQRLDILSGPQADSADAAEVEELKAQLETLREETVSPAALEALHAELGALREALPGAELEELRRGLEHAADRGELEDLRRDLAAVREAGPDPAIDELRRLHEQLRERAVARAEFDELQRALTALQEGGVGHTDLEAIREQLSLLSDGWAAKGDLDVLRGALDALGDRVPSRDELDALRQQFAEARRSVAGREELDQVRARLEGLASGEELDALRARVDGVRDGLAGVDAVDALRAQLDGLVARDELDAIRERVDGLAPAGELAALRDQVDGLAARGDDTERLDRLGADAEDLRGTVEALQAALAEARAEAAAAREQAAAGTAEAQPARAAADTATERIAEVDRGAGSVLAEVKTTRDRLEEVAGLARAAHEAAGDRADLDELRAGLARLGGEAQNAREALEQASAEALGARTQAATASEAAAAAREDAGRAREDAQVLRRELNTGRERLETAAADIARLGREVGTVREDGANAVRAVEEKLGGVDQTFTLLRADIGANREQFDSLQGGIERLAEQVAAGRAESEAKAAELLSELATVREVAEQAGAGVAELREELAALRTQTELANAVAERANKTAEAAKLDEELVDALQSEVKFALSMMDEMKAGLTSAGQAALVARREAEQAKKAADAAGDGTGEHVTQVFREILGLAAKGRPRTLPKGEDDTPPEPRDPRHGFDDESVPMAMIGVDGKFKELNPSFCRLVGYQEHEFAKAAWPSPHDRQHYAQQQEQFSELLSGTLESVPVQSTYMHGQGLMVPVIGEITAVKGEDGMTSHLLLRAEERERAL